MKKSKPFSRSYLKVVSGLFMLNLLGSLPAHAFFCKSKLMDKYQVTEGEAKALCNSSYSDAIEDSIDQGTPAADMKKTFNVLFAANLDQNKISYNNALQFARAHSDLQLSVVRSFSAKYGFDKGAVVTEGVSDENLKSVTQVLDEERETELHWDKFATFDGPFINNLFKNGSKAEIEAIPYVFHNLPEADVMPALNLLHDRTDEGLKILKSIVHDIVWNETGGSALKELEKAESLDNSRFVALAQIAAKFPFSRSLSFVETLSEDRATLAGELVSGSGGDFRQYFSYIQDTSLPQIQCAKAFGVKNIQTCSDLYSNRLCGAKATVLNALLKSDGTDTELKSEILKTVRDYDHFDKTHAHIFESLISTKGLTDSEKRDIVGPIASVETFRDGSFDVVQKELSKPFANIDTIKAAIKTNASVFEAGREFSSDQSARDSCDFPEGAVAFQWARSDALKQCADAYSGRKMVNCYIKSVQRLSYGDFRCTVEATASATYLRSGLKSCQNEDLREYINTAGKMPEQETSSQRYVSGNISKNSAGIPSTASMGASPAAVGGAAR